MELCQIVKGQQVFCQMEKEEKTNIIRHSTMKPPERFKKIEEFVRVFIALIFSRTVKELSTTLCLFYIFTYVYHNKGDRLILSYNSVSCLKVSKL